jgi:GNAT superfamily N-acetyltransferase
MLLSKSGIFVFYSNKTNNQANQPEKEVTLMRYQIRSATINDALALADIVLESTITTFRGLVPDHCLEWLTREESAANWAKWFGTENPHQFLLVAETETGQVVGCALGGEQRQEPDFQGQLYLMGVLPEYQRQGIGKVLVLNLLDHLIDIGIYTVGVRVMSVNPNRRFYEGLGAEYLREVPYEWNGVVLPQSVYRWVF